MRPRTIWIGVALLMCASALGAVLIARGAGATAPTGDIAVIESYTLHAAEGRLLVGPYSRFQWHHPGPIFFYWLAPFYGAAHRLTAGLNAAALVLALGALAAAAAVSLTAGGRASAIAVTVTLSAYALRASELLTSVWNPHAVVLPFALTIVAASAAASTSEWCLVIAAAAGSLAAQTHIGTVPVVVAVTGMAGASLAYRRRWKPLAAALAVAAALWAPALIEQATGPSGNLSAIWSFFVSGRAHGQPFPPALAVWASMLAAVVRPGFTVPTGGVLRFARSAPLQAYAAIALALLVVVAYVAVRRRARFEGSLAFFCLLASVVALWSVTRIEGDIMGYEVLWISAVGALDAGAIAAVLLGPWFGAAVSERVAVIICGAMLAVCAASGFAGLSDVRARSHAPDAEAAAIERAAAATREYLRQADVHRPMVDIDQASWPLAAAVLLQLQKAGVSYAVADDWVPMFTDEARATGHETQALSIAGAARHVVIRGRPGVVPVVAADPVYVDAFGNASATDAATPQQSAPITK